YLRDAKDLGAIGRTADRTHVRAIMDLFGQGPVSDDEFAFAYEEMAIDRFPRDVEWATRPSPEVVGQIKAVVIGAGISGIAAAIQLERLGIPYTVIERQADLGGTWNLNDYPGARV